MIGVLENGPRFSKELHPLENNVISLDDVSNSVKAGDDILSQHVYSDASSDPTGLGAHFQIHNEGIIFNPALSDLSQSVTTHPDMAPAPLPTLKPALTESVHLSLTWVYICMFGIIFLLVYIQLWMIWYYRHKRLSHQTLFLFQCLFWSGLRLSLFSFYFKNCDTANNLDIPFYWLLYCFPICLQFSMLCLLLHFFAQVVFKANAKYEPHQYKLPLRLTMSLSVIVFMGINLACAILTRQYEEKYTAPPKSILYVRVSLTEAMFLLYGILLCVCIFKMTKTASSQRVLEAKGTTVWKAVLASVLITLLFLSRTVYNFVSICMTTPNFGFDWINVSDQADAVSGLDTGLAYVSFGLVLFVWEVMPIVIVVFFFRVRRLHVEPVLPVFSTQAPGPRVFFFDDQRRYDSDEDLTHQDNNNTTHIINGGNNIPRSSPRTENHLRASPYVHHGMLTPNRLSSPALLHVQGTVDELRRGSYGSLGHTSGTHLQSPRSRPNKV